ncbi:Hpt domain-containing protein, partial [Leisingera sp. F5]|uniref:Hpt domain-containing protein n=1 Tax=Leisingera sp. F5 TaxID=1813816 RepID=UPI0025BE15EA
VSPERLAKALDSVMQGREGAIYLSARQAVLEQPDRRASLHKQMQENIRDLGATQAFGIATIFKQELPQGLARITKAQKTEDFGSLAKEAHRARGAASTFGQQDLAALLAALETGAEQGDLDATKDQLEKLTVLVPQILEALAAVLRECESVSSKAP